VARQRWRCDAREKSGREAAGALDGTEPGNLTPQALRPDPSALNSKPEALLDDNVRDATRARRVVARLLAHWMARSQATLRVEARRL